MKTSRRSFLKTGCAAAFGALAGAVGTAHAVPVGKPRSWDESFDFVIVGAGGAGLSAAAHASEGGLKTLVLEKQAFVGGSSLICGGEWSVAGTKYQQKDGIEDSDEKFVNDMLTTGQHMNDAELVKAFVAATKREFEWVTSHGVEPKYVFVASGMSVARAHHFNPADVIAFYKKYAEEHGAEIRTGVKVERLLWDAEKERIAGVRANQNGKTVFIEAKCGVLLSAGGFSRNPDLLAKYAPPMKYAAVIAGAGTQGDGILMAQAYGADMLDTNYVKASYGFRLNPKSIADMTTVYYSGAIMVNKDAKRFVDESISYKLLGDAGLSQPDHKSWLVLDEAIREYCVEKGGGENFWAPVAGGKSTDWCFAGNTIEEAAQKAGLDPKTLAETVKAYNETAPQGKDPLGRTSLSSGYGKPVPLAKAPFYIMPATAGMIGTYCGVRIDPQTHVIDVFGEKIKGLYAAGEMTGGVHGAAYMTGTAFGKANSFGRVAAETVLKERGS